MRCVILVYLAYLKGYWQNALLLGRETVTGTKKVRHDCSELSIAL